MTLETGCDTKKHFLLLPLTVVMGDIPLLTEVNVAVAACIR